MRLSEVRYWEHLYANIAIAWWWCWCWRQWSRQRWWRLWCYDNGDDSEEKFSLRSVRKYVTDACSWELLVWSGVIWGRFGVIFFSVIPLSTILCTLKYALQIPYLTNLAVVAKMPSERNSPHIVCKWNLIINALVVISYLFVAMFLAFVHFISIFIGPESDHWLCLSVTHSLTH